MGGATGRWQFSSGKFTALEPSSAKGDFEKYWSPLEKLLGCTYESSKDPETVFAVDVPPEVDVHAAYGLLEDGERANVWEFGEGHCGHPPKQP